MESKKKQLDFVNRWLRQPGAEVGALGTIALLLLLTVVSLGFLVAERSAREGRRIELINDSLWVEQTIRFEIESVTAELDRLASGITNQTETSTLMQQTSQLRRLHNSLARVTFLDINARVKSSTPALDPRRYEDVAGLEIVSRSLKLGERQYSAPYQDQNGSWRFDIAQAIQREGADAVLIASFDLAQMLKTLIPWWVTQKNHVRILSASSDILARNSSVETGLSEEVHSVSFDPPGAGMTISVTRLQAENGLLRFMLPILVAGLATIVGGSMIFLQRSIRKRIVAENRFGEENALRRSMEDALTIGMRARDRQGKIIYTNQAFCDMVGWTREELVGISPPMPYWDEALLEETVQIHDSILSGEIPKEGFELRFRRRSGEPLDVLIHEAPLNDASGQHVGWMASIVDVTERKRIAELSQNQADELARTARLVSIGEMASALAHEINQPLTAISTYATGLTSRMERQRLPIEQQRDILLKISTQARRAGEIIRHLREFTRRSEPNLISGDLRDVAERTAGFVEQDFARRSVFLGVHVGDEACRINGDQVLLEQVVLNLLRNAADAVADMPKANRKVLLTIGSKGERAILAVRDFGRGIDSAVGDKLFVPFFTTKPSGMGMGLNICRSIIELHGGRITHKNCDPGCVFMIELPFAKEAVLS